MICNPGTSPQYELKTYMEVGGGENKVFLVLFLVVFKGINCGKGMGC